MAYNVGARLTALEQKVKRLTRGSRLASTSIEDTAVQVYDQYGSLRAVIGQQGDGTTAANIVNGPIPPTPTAPQVSPALGALAVTWGGAFADSAVPPLDWLRVEVHVGATAGFTPSQATLRDTIETPQGGTVTVPLSYTAWWVKLRSRTTSGVPSPATDGVSGTPRQAAAADIQAGSITADKLAALLVLASRIVAGDPAAARVEFNDTGLRAYQADGSLAVEITPDGGSYGEAAVVSYNGDATFRAALASGSLAFGATAGTYFQMPGITGSGTTDPISLVLLSGRAASGNSSSRMVMQSSTSGAPQIYATGDNGTLDYWIDGKLRANNVVTGTVVITPSAAGVPTPATITGLNVAGAVIRGYATANTTVPGDRSPTGNAGVTGVSVSSVSATGLTVWVNRQNTNPTTVYYRLEGADT